MKDYSKEFQRLKENRILVPGAQLLNYKGPSYYRFGYREYNESEVVKKYFSNALDRIIERNGLGYVKGSIKYNQILRRLTKDYHDVLKDIVPVEIADGNRIVFFRRLYAMSVVNLPPKKRYGEIRYRYIHEFKGDRPILMFSFNPRNLSLQAFKRKVDRKALLIQGRISRAFMGRVYYKRKKENVKYSNNFSYYIESASKR